MATIQSPMQRCNAVLRAFGARYRLREHRRSPWITVYQLGKGGTTREHTVKGYAAADPEAIESLQDLLIDPLCAIPDGNEPHSFALHRYAHTCAALIPHLWGE